MSNVSSKKTSRQSLAVCGLSGLLASASFAPAEAIVLIDEDFSGGSIPSLFSDASNVNAAASAGALVVTDTGSQTAQANVNYSDLPAFQVNSGSSTPQLHINFDIDVTRYLAPGATSSGIRFMVEDNSAPSKRPLTFGFNFGGKITAGVENPLLAHQLVFSQKIDSSKAGGTGNFFTDGNQGTIGHDPAGQAGLGSLWHDFGLANFPGDGGAATDNTSDGVVNVDIFIDTLAGSVATTLTHLASGDIGTRMDSSSILTGVSIGVGDGANERFRWLTAGGSVTDAEVIIDNVFIEAVPEPASLALFAAGACGLIRRQRA